MKIKSKLRLNSAIVVVAMGVIVALAIFGSRYTNSQIKELTQKTTPYQVKALNLQRSLQSHAANLLSVSTSFDLAEFTSNEKAAKDSLIQLKKSYEEMALLNGNSSSDDVLNITEITNAFFEKTQLKLSANEKAYSAAQAIGQKNSAADQQIRELDSSIRRLQKNTSTTMISGVGGVLTVNQQVNSLSVARDGLKDLSLYIAKIPNTNDKRTVATLRDNSAGTIKAVIAALKSTKGMDKAVGDMIMRLNTLSEKVTASRGLAFLQINFINDEDESLRERIETLSKEGVYEISYIMPTIERAISNANGVLKGSTDEMSKSINAFSETNAILSSAAELSLLSSSIHAYITQFVNVKSSKEITGSLSRVEEVFARTESTTRKLGSLLPKGRHKKEQAMLSSFSGSLSACKQEFLGKDGVADRVRTAIKNTEELDALNGKMKGIVAKQLGESNQQVSSAGINQEKAIIAVNRISKLTMLITGIVGSLAICCVTIIGVWIGRSITRPLLEAAEMSSHITLSGDLTKRLEIKSDDEIAEVSKSFNTMVDKIHSTISTVLEKVNTVALSSSNLTATAENISKKAGFQANQSVELNISAEKMCHGVNAVANNAGKSAELSEDTKRIAADGGVVIMETIDGINKFAGSIREVSTTIQKLAGRSEKIGEIAQVIKDIADQTNLLALNAAIEAARAGEQGRGFAVVADEVRALAERTTNATSEIAGMIQNIQLETEQSATAINRGIGEINLVVDVANRAGEALNQIIQKIDNTSEMIQQMVIASSQQFATVENMNGSIRNISEASQEFACATTHIATAAEDLDKVSLELKGLVKQFVI